MQHNSRINRDSSVHYQPGWARPAFVLKDVRTGSRRYEEEHRQSERSVFCTSHSALEPSCPDVGLKLSHVADQTRAPTRTGFDNRTAWGQIPKWQWCIPPVRIPRRRAKPPRNIGLFAISCRTLDHAFDAIAHLEVRELLFPENRKRESSGHFRIRKKKMRFEDGGKRRCSWVQNN